MPDVFDKQTRSRVMAAIRARNTKPELLVRRYLHLRGLRFRIHVRQLPGNPDIVLKKYRTIIFIHGCFWHQHKGCRHAAVPKTNATFWAKKLADNRSRDQRVAQRLRRLGWRVLTIWECSLDEKAMEQLWRRIVFGFAKAEN